MSKEKIETNPTLEYKRRLTKEEIIEGEEYCSDQVYRESKRKEQFKKLTSEKFFADLEMAKSLVLKSLEDMRDIYHYREKIDILKNELVNAASINDASYKEKKEIDISKDQYVNIALKVAGPFEKIDKLEYTDRTAENRTIECIVREIQEAKADLPSIFRIEQTGSVVHWIERNLKEAYGLDITIPENPEDIEKEIMKAYHAKLFELQSDFE